MRDIEQNGGIGISDAVVVGFEIGQEPFLKKLMEFFQAPKYVANALDTFLNFTNTAYGAATESHETYVRDGVTLQDGDSYVDVSLYYDMGVEYHEFRFYFRNGYPLVTNLEQFVVRCDDDIRVRGVAAQLVEEYAEKGYVPSKIHMPRGAYWPLK